MKKDEAAKRLFKEEHPVDIAELVRIDVPIVQDTSYDTGFLVSDNLDDLETGIIAARKVGDFCWYAIACSIAKIIDGGLYTQAGLSQKEYVLQTRERLGIDKRRFHEFLSSGRFLIDHGQKLLSMGWRPEGMQKKIQLANTAKKVVKSEAKLLDHIMNDSIDKFRALISKGKSKINSKGPKQDSNLDGRKLLLAGKHIATIEDAAEGTNLEDLIKILETFAESRKAGGRIACFVVETERQALNAPRVFSDYVNGKLQRKKK